MSPQKASCFWRRKFSILFGLILFTVTFFVVREKYFYRADVLLAVVPNAQKTLDNQRLTKVKVEIKETQTSILGWIKGGLGFKNSKKEATVIDKAIVWDKWMEKQTTYTSIGDIYDKCDNKTRIKVGKVVLQPKKNGEGVEIKSYLNITYDYDILTSQAHMEVYYNDDLLYEKNKDMCEAAKELDTPYTCPIKAGKTLVIRDVAKMPSYIPKGKYRIFSTIKDQFNREIGCTYIEFKTGDKTK